MEERQQWTRARDYWRPDRDIRDLKSADDIAYCAAAILGQAIGRQPRRLRHHRQRCRHPAVVRDWNAPGVETLAGITALRDYGNFIDDLKLDKFVVDRQRRRRSAHRAPATAPARAQRRGIRQRAARGTGPSWWRSSLSTTPCRAPGWRRTRPDRRWPSASAPPANACAAKRRCATAKRSSAPSPTPCRRWCGRPCRTASTITTTSSGTTSPACAEVDTDGEGWNAMFHPEDRERAWQRWQHSLGHRQDLRNPVPPAPPLRRLPLGARARAAGARRGRAHHPLDGHLHRHPRPEDWPKTSCAWPASARTNFWPCWRTSCATRWRRSAAPRSCCARTTTTEQRVQHASEIIVRQVRHMTELVDDLLDVSRVTRGLVADREGRRSTCKSSCTAPSSRRAR